MLVSRAAAVFGFYLPSPAHQKMFSLDDGKPMVRSHLGHRMCCLMVEAKLWTLPARGEYWWIAFSYESVSKIYLFMYLRERDRSFMYWYTPQMVTVAMAGPRWSQELETPLGTWVSLMTGSDSSIWDIICCWIGCRAAVTRTSALTWDGGITGGGLTCYATMLIQCYSCLLRLTRATPFWFWQRLPVMHNM